MPAQLTAVLRAPEVMLQPSAGDARLTLGRLVRGVVESAKAFVRWMDGTCVACGEASSPRNTSHTTPFDAVRLPFISSLQHCQCST